MESSGLFILFYLGDCVVNVASFRLAFTNGVYLPHWAYTGENCDTFWSRLDPGFTANGSPVDLIYWKDGKVHYPSAGVVLSREGYGTPTAVPDWAHSHSYQHVGPLRQVVGRQ